MTEVSMAWLERVVEARRRTQEANRQIATLRALLRRGDETSSTYDERASEALLADGTGFRLQALRNRVAVIEFDLRQAECQGSTVGPVLMALTEVNDTLLETILATALMLEKLDSEPVEDPFIDRLEEHPAYERN